MFNTMREDEDSQFHLDLSPKNRLKNEETTKRPRNLCSISQKEGNSLVGATETGKNTLLMPVNRGEDDVCSRLKDSKTLEEKNVTQR